MPRKGEAMSNEHKKKISISHIGIRPSEETKIKIANSKRGKCLSIEHRRCISSTLVGNKHAFGTKRTMEDRLKIKMLTPRGERHYNWKGGLVPINKAIRKSHEYKLWRESVFLRDNYSCVGCGDNKGGNLEADHIKPFAHYPELRFDINNGRTLCHNCHKNTDTYGYKSKNKINN